MNLFEANIIYWIQENLRHPILNPIVTAITSLGNTGIFWIILALVLIAFKKTRRVGLICALALILDVLAVNVLIKPLVARPRPYAVMEAIVPLGHLSMDFSFPSGHSAVSFAAAAALYFTTPRKYGAAALVLAALIALSRLYVGVHYPTDVLAGCIIGAALGWIASIIGKRLMRK